MAFALGPRARDLDAFGVLDNQGLARGRPYPLKDRDDPIGLAAVAAQQLVGGVWPDDRQSLDLRGVERKHAVILQQDDRLLSHLARQVRGGRSRHAPGAGRVDIGIFEQARLELHRQDASNGGVDLGFFQPSGARQIPEPGIGRPLRQVDVDARLHRGKSRFIGIRGDMVERFQFPNAAVVAEIGALETKPSSPDVLQQGAIAVRRNTRDLVIRRHDDRGVGAPDDPLERRKIDLSKRPFRHVGRPDVQSPLRRAVDKMFERGEHLVGRQGTRSALQALHSGKAHFAGQVGILAEELFHAAPTRVPHEVEHRAEGDRHAA
jgi:hypothetical protein